MKRISRRTVLRGLGTALSLPFLEAMAPLAAAASSGNRPVRLAWLFVDNGVNLRYWNPAKTGLLTELPATLKPLDGVKDEVLVLSGLTHDKARANGDGPGDHARASATFLTGRQARKTEGKDIRVGVSIDQVAASYVGERTRLPSLELGCDRGALSGNCDSGYSCAYSSNISWRTPSAPMAKLVHPREVFHRLFGDADQGLTEQERARRAADAGSVLDLVQEDAKRVRGSLGRADQSKLDDYLEAVRSVERRVQSDLTERRSVPKMDLPAAIPAEYPQHAKLLLDLLVLAFQTDTTRISTFMFANAGSERTFPFIGVREGHHTLSHHGGDRDKLDKLRRIDEFYVGLYAYFLEKLRGVREGEGTLLDQCLIVYGGAIGDGNAHNHEDLPILMAGRGGGAVKTGRHLKFKRETPMCNLFLKMLEIIDVRVDSFGDSTGRVSLE